MRTGSRKLNVIPAQAGTQVTLQGSFGSLVSRRSLRSLALPNVTHLRGRVNWAPAFAGVTPNIGDTFKSRVS
jgi:hypothetical protein